MATNGQPGIAMPVPAELQGIPDDARDDIAYREGMMRQYGNNERDIRARPNGNWNGFGDWSHHDMQSTAEGAMDARRRAQAVAQPRPAPPPVYAEGGFVDDDEDYSQGPEMEAYDGTMSHYDKGGGVDPGRAIAHAAVSALHGLHDDPDGALTAFEGHFGPGSTDGLRSTIFGKGDDPEAGPAESGGVSGFINDDSGGMDDAVTVPGPRGEVGLSGGEYVLTADTVSNIGDGNSLAGKKLLDQFVEYLRQLKNGHTDQPAPTGRAALMNFFKHLDGAGEE